MFKIIVLLVLTNLTNYSLNAEKNILEMQIKANKDIEQATLGGGCFWCIEAIFELVPGVSEVHSGYTGGIIENPKYEDICKGNTGHAEVVQIHYNPIEISYESILEIFWKIHDPTTLNSQGADIGTQYRSVIFYNSNVQKVISEKSIIKAQKNFKDEIVTELSPLKKFYLAEDYHQEFYKKNPTNSYCRYNFDKKIAKVKDLIK